MPQYDYVCRTCGAKTVLDRRPKDGVEMRHLIPSNYKGVSIVCGNFRRDYSTVNINKENLRGR